MNNITILAVDDVEANRISLQYLIHEYIEHVDLILASNGEDALKISYQKDIDIIILDIQMPGLDGFDTAKYLKSNPKTKNIPIIFLTAAFKEEEFQQKGFEIGAIDYLTKPIENHQFINKLKLYIEVIIKTKQLEAVNSNLYIALEKEIKLKNRIENQQLELIEQSKMAALGEMISNIAHQWRQPLSVISTCASGMKLQKEANILDEDSFFNNIDKIVETTNNLSKTIDTFRNFTQKDNVNEFDLSSVIKKSIESQKYIFDLNGIELITNYQEDIKITNYQNSLFQSLINLIHNSRDILQNINTKKYIFIETKENENGIIISFKDNGGGIKTEFISKIFEPYFTTKHQSHGIGVGLNITYKLINDAMRGKIKVRNSRFTYNDESFEGAEFIISLPKEI